MKVYYQDKEITREEAEEIVAGQIGTVVAREVLEGIRHWEDLSEEERIPLGANIIITYFDIYGHIDLGLWEGEDGKLYGGWRLYPAHFGLRVEDDFECDLKDIID